MSRATHIPCSGPPDATEFAKWYLPFVGHHYGTCLMSPFWGLLDFWKMFKLSCKDDDGDGNGSNNSSTTVVNARTE
jgi:hypothetical protein